MENITMRTIAVTPAMPSARALALPCATDLRTSRVRSNVRLGLAIGEATAVQGQRVRATAPTTGMGHVGTSQVVFGAGYVPGSPTWSPPI